MELWCRGEERGGCRSVLSSVLHCKPWLVFLPPKYVFRSYWICHYHNELPAFILNNLLYYKLYANCIRFLMPKHERWFSQQTRWLSVLKSWHWFPWRDLTRTLHLTLPAPCWLRSGPREVVPWPQSLAESWGEGSGRRLVPTLGYREGAGCWWLLLLECNAKGHHAYATFVWMLVFSLFCFYLHLLNRTLDLKKIKTVVLVQS